MVRHDYDTCDALSQIIDAEFPLYQNQGVCLALKSKRALLSYDTGMGKTFAYAFFVRALLNRDPTKKHIFIGLLDQIKQTPDDLRNLVEVYVTAHNAAHDSLSKLERTWTQSSIIFLTYECFRNDSFLLWFYNHLSEVESITVDEAHRVSNWDSSDTAFSIRALVSKVPYCIALTATPITSSNKQFYRLMNLVSRDIGYRSDETRRGNYLNHYLSASRSQYNIKGNYTAKVAWVEPEGYQLQPVSGIVFKSTKWHGATRQVNRLVSLLRSRSDKRCLVYIAYHEAREWVEEHLKKAGIRYAAINGRVVGVARDAEIERFRSGEVSILLTSVAESLNLESDCCIFYEFNTKVKQVIGRSHRSLTGKALEIIFILTRDTPEVDYFMRYIYQRSLTIQRLLGKDYSELIKVGEVIENQNSLE